MSSVRNDGDASFQAVSSQCSSCFRGLPPAADNQSPLFLRVLVESQQMADFNHEPAGNPGINDQRRLIVRQRIDSR
jgi:hypothetical protein